MKHGFRAWRRAAVGIAGVAFAQATGCGGGSDGAGPAPVSLPAAPEVVEVAGARAADLQAAVDAFRARLGPNNGAAAATLGGRREINWDGVPLDRLDPFPGDFFQVGSPRGVVFSTPGTRMKVSGDVGSPSFEFADVTARLPNGQPWGPIEFGTFSASRMFATLGSTITELRFSVPGTTSAASVGAFGVVLADVDVAQATSIELHAADGRLLLRHVVAPAGARSEGLTFVGVLLPTGSRAARVRIVAGTHPVDAPFQDPPPDGVGIDDVIYAEPIAD